MPITEDQVGEIEAQRASERPTRRAVSRALEEMLYRPIPVLDHGFVRVVDYMGDDSAIVQAARVSYGKGTKSMRDDAGLIGYLMRRRHSTPFEMCEIKYHVKLPIFVARQWIRHRTANVNEYSARYSILDREFYVPDEAHLRAMLAERRDSLEGTPDMFSPATEPGERSALAGQSRSNKQGREGALTDEEARRALSRIDWHSKRAYGGYENLLNEDGLAREIARTVLPVNVYTQFYWKIDLHNLLHFLALRLDPHAQYEIRAYAGAMLETVRAWVPLACDAFVENRLNGAELTASQLAVVRRMIAGEKVTRETSGLSRRVWDELRAALDE